MDAYEKLSPTYEMIYISIRITIYVTNQLTQYVAYVYYRTYFVSNMQASSDIMQSWLIQVSFPFLST